VVDSRALFTTTFQPEHVMIKVMVLYPNAPDAKFDMKYYVTHHLPMVRDRCAPECRSIAADGGLAGGEPGSRAPYIAVGHLTFDSVAAFEKAFGPNATEILADIPNFTNTQPIIQISEITLDSGTRPAPV
jgi:uncharacterized protein (TIGR02118 family)